jgi:hypothetical protein
MPHRIAQTRNKLLVSVLRGSAGGMRRASIPPQEGALHGSRRHTPDPRPRPDRGGRRARPALLLRAGLNPFRESHRDRPTGVASILLETELPEQVALAERHAGRIGQLGGAITHDPTQFVDRAQLPSPELPDDPDDLDSVLRYALEQEQRTIDRYGPLLDRVRGLDARHRAPDLSPSSPTRSRARTRSSRL